MAYTTIYNDIVFIEGDSKYAKRFKKIKSNIGGIGAQLKNLNDVKANMSKQAKIFGCNCIVDFKYGQKSSWFSIDDIKFYGSGVCAKLDASEYEKIKNKNNNINN